MKRLTVLILLALVAVCVKSQRRIITPGQNLAKDGQFPSTVFVNSEEKLCGGTRK